MTDTKYKAKELLDKKWSEEKQVNANEIKLTIRIFMEIIFMNKLFKPNQAKNIFLFFAFYLFVYFSSFAKE